MAFQGEEEGRGRIEKNPERRKSQAWSARRPGTRAEIHWGSGWWRACLPMSPASLPSPPPPMSWGISAKLSAVLLKPQLGLGHRAQLTRSLGSFPQFPHL